MTGTNNQNADDLGIQAAEEATWTTFLNNNQIRSFAIGLGSGITNIAALDPIAYYGHAGENTAARLVSDFNQLEFRKNRGQLFEYSSTQLVRYQRAPR